MQFGKKEMRILMVGLDAAGKTTILYKLKLGEGRSFASTHLQRAFPLPPMTVQLVLVHAMKGHLVPALACERLAFFDATVY